MQRQPVESLDDPRLADYRNVRDPELLASSGVFMCEGRLGVRRMLALGRFHPRSVFVTPTAFEALADAWPKLPPGTPVYVGSRALLSRVVGFNLHRGCLAAVERGPARAPGEVLRECGATRLMLLLEEVTNPDNVGSIFRSAVAFGAGGVWLTGGCADPLYRKATRVSMGATLSLPFARIPAAVVGFDALHRSGRSVMALTPDPAAEPIEAVARRFLGRPLTLALGGEALGLSAAALERADARCRIPMAAGVDSLNVGTAAGIALHRFATLPGGAPPS